MSNSKFKKEDIIAVLKSVLKEDQIVNINNFNNEVLLDIIPSNPTHKAKSELSKKIIETLKNDYNSNYDYKIDFKSIPKTIQNNDSEVLSSVKNVFS